MADSILLDVALACNVDESDRGFDTKLIPLINSQIMMAHQFGIGYNGFTVTGLQETYQDLLGEHCDFLAAFRTWLGYSVLLLFDPPENGTMLKSYQDQLAKMEWMLNSKAELDGAVKDYVPEYAEVYNFYDEEEIDAYDDD